MQSNIVPSSFDQNSFFIMEIYQPIINEKMKLQFKSIEQSQIEK